MTEYCFGFVEDAPSAAVAKKLMVHRNESSEQRIEFIDGFPQIMRGFGNIRRDVSAYVNMAGSGQRIIVLVDLDDTDCAPTLVRSWFSFEEDSEICLPRPLIFRVAVREVESWVMADRSNLATFLGVSVDNLPLAPDALSDPKAHLLNVIRRKGRKKWHREMLPQGRTASIGPRYNEKLCDFIVKHWSPHRDAENSGSLRKEIAALAKT